MAGKKCDEGKLDWHALPLALVELLVPVAVAGAKKYGRGNILEPFDEADRRFYSATLRHVRACQHNPLAVDEETGCYHAAQAAYDLLARVYQCELMTAAPSGYSLPPLDDGDDDPGVVKLEAGGNKKVAVGPEMIPGGGEAIADGCSRGDAWSWKMEHCKTNGLTPADAENWSRAERAFRAFTRGVQRRSDEVIAEIEKQHRDEIAKIEREHLVNVAPDRTSLNDATARQMYERQQREVDDWPAATPPSPK